MKRFVLIVTLWLVAAQSWAATIYVNSAATGSNNGTSKTDAYTSIASATGAAAGDVVWISHTHSEALSASTNLAFNNATYAAPIRIVSVNFGTDAYQAGATLSTSSGLLRLSTGNGRLDFYGLSFAPASNMEFHWTGAAGTIELQGCTITPGGAPLLHRNVVVWKNTTLNLSGSSNAKFQGNSTPYATFTWRGGTLTPHASQLYFGWIQAGWNILVEDVTITGALSSRLLEDTASGFNMTFRRVKHGGIGSSQQTGIKGNAWILLDSCSSSSTITVPPVGTQLFTINGTVQGDLTRYRTGGATDGLQANAFSWEMTKLAGDGIIQSMPLTRFLDPDASISSATAKGIFTSTRCAPLATPANLDTDGVSTWNGSGVGTKQQIDHTLTNGDTLTVYVASGGTLNNDDFWIEVSEPDQVGGPVSVRCFLAKPSTTVYVDPQLYINGSASGKAYMTEGVQIFEPTGGGGGSTTIIQQPYLFSLATPYTIPALVALYLLAVGRVAYRRKQSKL